MIELNARERRLWDRVREQIVRYEPGAASGLRDVLLLLVEEHLSRHILERIREVGELDATPGTGIAVQLDVEDAVGIAHQVDELANVVEGEL